MVETSKSILVTGGMGTLGKPLVKFLKSNGHNVIVCDLKHSNEDYFKRCDISEYRQLDLLFNNYKFDFVYHLAAEFGRNNGEDYYEQLWKTNVIGTKHIIKMQEKYDFKLIFASSSEIYGELNDSIAYKEDTTSKYPLKHYNDYAITKFVNEKQIMNSIEQNGTKSMILRFFNAYGPGEYYHPYRSVIALFIYKALMNKKLTVYQDYHRVFQYIDDFINTVGNCHNHFKSGEIYNIGGTEYSNMEDVARKILKLTDRSESLINLIPKEKANVVNKRPDISKAMKDLHHNPTILLDIGLPLTIKWMKETYF